MAKVPASAAKISGLLADREEPPTDPIGFGACELTLVRFSDDEANVPGQGRG